jgi:hypothetical protein
MKPKYCNARHYTRFSSGKMPRFGVLQSRKKPNETPAFAGVTVFLGLFSQ